VGVTMQKHSELLAWLQPPASSRLGKTELDDLWTAETWPVLQVIALHSHLTWVGMMTFKTIPCDRFCFAIGSIE
jgi:hypothetical protein